MPKNLREKLALVLDDCQDLQKWELLQRLERVVNEEIGFMKAEHQVDSVDLSTIQSYATKEYNDMRLDEQALGRIYGDGNLIRVLCYINAVLSHFRSKGLISFNVTLNKKK